MMIGSISYGRPKLEMINDEIPFIVNETIDPDDEEVKSPVPLDSCTKLKEKII